MTLYSPGGLNLADTTAPLILAYDDSGAKDVVFAVSSSGDLTITPDGGDVTVAANVTITGTLFVDGEVTLGTAGATNAIVNAPESMFFNVDSNGDQSGRKFVWAHNATGSGGTVLMQLDDDGGFSVGTPATVSGTGLMVTANSSAVQEVMRDSSSARWKTDIVDAEIDPRAVLAIRAKEYGRPVQDGRFTGFLVEDFHNAGFHNIIAYDDEGPAGFLEFGRGITALHQVVLQSHDERIEVTESREDRLEGCVRHLVGANPTLEGRDEALALLEAA